MHYNVWISRTARSRRHVVETGWREALCGLRIDGMDRSWVLSWDAVPVNLRCVRCRVELAEAQLLDLKQEV